MPDSQLYLKLCRLFKDQRSINAVETLHAKSDVLQKQHIIQLIETFKRLCHLINKLDIALFPNLITDSFLKYIELKIAREKEISKLIEIQKQLKKLTILLDNLNTFKSTLEIHCKNPKTDKVYEAAKKVYSDICIEILPYLESLDNEDTKNNEKYNFLNESLLKAAAAIRNQNILERDVAFNELRTCSINARKYQSYKNIIRGSVCLFIGTLITGAALVGIIPLAGLFGIILISLGELIILEDEPSNLYTSLFNLVTACRETPQSDSKNSLTTLRLHRNFIKDNQEKISFIPAQFRQEDQKANGKLYDDEEITRIFDLSENKNFRDDKRIKKAFFQQQGIQKARWDFIPIPDKKIGYIVYKGKNAGHLGSGTYAFTKLAQCSKTGHLCVLKIIKKNNKYNSKTYKKEIAALKLAGQYIHSYKRKNKNNEDQYEILMELAPGIKMYDFIYDSKIKVTTEELLKQFIAMAEGVAKLQQQKIIHADLHAKNYMFHRESCTVTPIDFGLAVILKDDSSIMYHPSRYLNKILFFLLQKLHGMSTATNRIYSVLE